MVRNLRRVSCRAGIGTGESSKRTCRQFSMSFASGKREARGVKRKCPALFSHYSISYLCSPPLNFFPHAEQQRRGSVDIRPRSLSRLRNHPVASNTTRGLRHARSRERRDGRKNGPWTPSGQMSGRRPRGWPSVSGPLAARSGTTPRKSKQRALPPMQGGEGRGPAPPLQSRSAVGRPRHRVAARLRGPTRYPTGWEMMFQKVPAAVVAVAVMEPMSECSNACRICVILLELPKAPRSS